MRIFKPLYKGKGVNSQRKSAVIRLMCMYLDTPQNTSKHVLELQREGDNSTAATEDLYNPLLETDTSNRQEMSRDTTKFLIFNQMDIMGICRPQATSFISKLYLFLKHS